MAVSLGPSGLAGDGGGVVVSTGTLATLGLNTAGEGGNIICPLPSGYDRFRVFMRWKHTTDGVNKASVYMPVFGSGGSQLAVEANTWRAKRNNAMEHVDGSSTIWPRVSDNVDPGNLNSLLVEVDGQYGPRPDITYTGNYTHASVGSSLVFGSMHFNAFTRYTGVGINVDVLAVVDFEYRVVGYAE